MQWLTKTLYRGVAQLVARLLWEQDVGSSSLFTPTKNKSKPSGLGLFFIITKDSNPDTLNTNRRLPALGTTRDRVLWTMKGAFCGVAVKIVRREQRANNFGHRKRRQSRGCREFEPLHSDHKKSNTVRYCSFYFWKEKF